MADEYTLPLADPGAMLEIAGGKGASLAKLANAGLPVPGGFHITTARTGASWPRTACSPRYSRRLRPRTHRNPGLWTKPRQDIAGLFAGATVSPDISRAIATAYGDLPGKDPAVAVRSSATAEDLPGMSFAGQQETFLNVHGIASAQDAVKRCWASLWTARAMSTGRARAWTRAP